MIGAVNASAVIGRFLKFRVAVIMGLERKRVRSFVSSADEKVLKRVNERVNLMLRFGVYLYRRLR